MKTVAVALLISATVLALCAAPARAQGPKPAPKAAPAADAAVVSIQFDNSARSVEAKNNQVRQGLAEVLFVPAQNIKFQTCIAQSRLGGLVSSQSTCTYSVVGPTTNRRTVLQNCQESIRTGLGGVIGLDSRAENAIEKATNNRLIPGDKIELEKATCAQA